jgi:hypothetical protein
VSDLLVVARPLPDEVGYDAMILTVAKVDWFNQST